MIIKAGKCSAVFTKNLSMNSKGPAVKKLNLLLYRLGFKSKESSTFTSTTRTGIKAFQEEYDVQLTPSDNDIERYEEEVGEKAKWVGIWNELTRKEVNDLICGIALERQK
jgi:peptidoglycan hydrolase-like protein with peptidoglycan-binding domain